MGELEASTTTTPFAERVRSQLTRKFQEYLDLSTIYTKTRWAFFVLATLMYLLRVYILDGCVRGACLRSRRALRSLFSPCPTPSPPQLVHCDVRTWHLHAEPLYRLPDAAGRAGSGAGSSDEGRGRVQAIRPEGTRVQVLVRRRSTCARVEHVLSPSLSAPASFSPSLHVSPLHLPRVAHCTLPSLPRTWPGSRSRKRCSSRT